MLVLLHELGQLVLNGFSLAELPSQHAVEIARRILPRSELLERGGKDINGASAASLEVLIGRIRRKLGVDIIRTQRGGGYSLEVP